MIGERAVQYAENELRSPVAKLLNETQIESQYIEEAMHNIINESRAKLEKRLSKF